MAEGIYVVESGSRRYVVIADSGSDAAELIAARLLPSSAIPTAEIAGLLDQREELGDKLLVARIGTYDPGILGSKYGNVITEGPL